MKKKVEDKLFLDRFRVDEEPHLRIRDGSVCRDQCTDQPCLFFCPANLPRAKSPEHAKREKGK